MTIKITRLASRLMAMKYHTNKGAFPQGRSCNKREGKSTKYGKECKDNLRRKHMDLSYLLCSGIEINLRIFLNGGKSKLNGREDHFISSIL